MVAQEGVPGDVHGDGYHGDVHGDGYHGDVHSGGYSTTVEVTQWRLRRPRGMYTVEVTVSTGMYTVVGTVPPWRLQWWVQCRSGDCSGGHTRTRTTVGCHYTHVPAPPHVPGYPTTPCTTTPCTPPSPLCHQSRRAGTTMSVFQKSVLTGCWEKPLSVYKRGPALRETGLAMRYRGRH